MNLLGTRKMVGHPYKLHYIHTCIHFPRGVSQKVLAEGGSIHNVLLTLIARGR